MWIAAQAFVMRSEMIRCLLDFLRLFAWGPRPFLSLGLMQRNEKHRLYADASIHNVINNCG
jgi:hypothetical protein